MLLYIFIWKILPHLETYEIYEITIKSHRQQSLRIFVANQEVLSLLNEAMLTKMETNIVDSKCLLLT